MVIGEARRDLFFGASALNNIVVFAIDVAGLTGYAATLLEFDCAPTTVPDGNPSQKRVEEGAPGRVRVVCCLPSVYVRIQDMFLVVNISWERAQKLECFWVKM